MAPGHKIYPYLLYAARTAEPSPWRSLKYEEVYLKDYADAGEARVGIGGIAFYNGRQPHRAR
jgi:hypothetical protein